MAQNMKILTTFAGLLAFNGFVELAHAQPAPTTIAFPMIGVGFKQFLQLNVITFPPNPCAITVGVFGSKGEVIVAFEDGSPDRPLIVGNQVSSFPQRKEIRPVVILSPPPGSAIACQGQATAEVFDDLTKTDTVVTPGLIPPGPQTLPIFFGPVGLISEQTARLNVVAHPPEPCFGSIGFTDTNGNPIGSPMSVSLMPNQATFVDLAGLRAVTAARDLRPEVIGVFTPSPTTAPGVCIVSVEVFGDLTGYTRVLIPPGPQQLPAAAR
jgi:hypothetical protein